MGRSDGYAHEAGRISGSRCLVRAAERPHAGRRGYDPVHGSRRTSSAFTSSTLLTSYPAGNLGIPSNINWPGGGSITTPGFIYGKAGYASPDGTFSADLYFWGVSDIVDMSWADARYSFARLWLQPYVALQAGWVVQCRHLVHRNIYSSLSAFRSARTSPRRSCSRPGTTRSRGDTIRSRCRRTSPAATRVIRSPPKARRCLVIPAAQRGTVSRSPGPNDDDRVRGLGQSVRRQFESALHRLILARHGESPRARSVVAHRRDLHLGQRAACSSRCRCAGTTTRTSSLRNGPPSGIWMEIDRFMRVPASGPYHGLQLRYRYAERTFTDTYCGAAATNCAPGTPVGVWASLKAACRSSNITGSCWSTPPRLEIVTCISNKSQ